MSNVTVISPSQFAGETAQTPGSERLSAIAPSQGIDTPLWGGLFNIEPGAQSGIHHHGVQHTIAYVLSGECLVIWGERGEFNATARSGDFLHIPAWLLHREINASNIEVCCWVVVRSTPEPIVVNFPEDRWPQDEQAAATR